MRRVAALLIAATVCAVPACSQAKVTAAAPVMWLGATVQELNSDFAGYFGIKASDGVLVSSVVNPGPAWKAGIKPGDVLQTFDGKNVASIKELVTLVASARENASVKVSVLRGRKHMSFEVKITDKPRDLEWRGLHVSSGHSPLMIAALDAGSEALEAGLQVSDVLLEVNGVKIDFPVDFTDSVSGSKGPVLVRTARGYFLVKDTH